MGEREGERKHAEHNCKNITIFDKASFTKNHIQNIGQIKVYQIPAKIYEYSHF